MNKFDRFMLKYVGKGLEWTCYLYAFSAYTLFWLNKAAGNELLVITGTSFVLGLMVRWTNGRARKVLEKADANRRKRDSKSNAGTK